MMLISHMTIQNNLTAANQRIQMLEQRLEQRITQLEIRGMTARQRARRSAGPPRREEGTRDDPIILMDDDDRLRRGLPPRPDTPIPGLNRSPSPAPVPIPPPRASGSGPGPIRSSRGQRVRRLTSEERARWMRPVTDSDDLYE